MKNSCPNYIYMKLLCKIKFKQYVLVQYCDFTITSNTKIERKNQYRLVLVISSWYTVFVLFNAQVLIDAHPLTRKTLVKIFYKASCHAARDSVKRSVSKIHHTCCKTHVLTRWVKWWPLLYPHPPFHGKWMGHDLGSCLSPVCKLWILWCERQCDFLPVNKRAPCNYLRAVRV